MTHSKEVDVKETHVHTGVVYGNFVLAKIFFLQMQRKLWCPILNSGDNWLGFLTPIQLFLHWCLFYYLNCLGCIQYIHQIEALTMITYPFALIFARFIHTY